MQVNPTYTAGDGLLLSVIPPTTRHFLHSVEKQPDTKNWDVRERGEGVKQLIWMVNQADYEMKWSVRQPESHNARLQQVYSKCLLPLFPFISTKILLHFFGVSQSLTAFVMWRQWNSVELFQLSCNLSRCCVELEEEVISGQLVLMSLVSYLQL